ncbi:MAG TPA: hypothetical protein DCL35_03435 [Candidatus Omnitrophica bacterium]|nr:hypothetical protein [Candidatus Omnitrophota bacterium]
MAVRWIFRKRSFTLVEMLVVVIILGVLVSVAMPTYVQTKRKGEYNAALGQVRMITGVARDYYLTQGSYPTTTNTGNTNAVFGIRVYDGFFNNYRVISGSPFTVQVTGGACVYTFNNDGVRISTNGAADCVS